MLKKLRNNDISCCMSSEERQKYEKSRRIDRELAEYEKKYAALQKIVLLGAGESGKSTFLKQMQIIHGKGFKLQEKLAYRTQIYENILRGMAGLINGKKELRLPWRGNFFTSSINPENISEKDSLKPIDDLALRMKSIVVEFTNIYKRLIEERDREQTRSNTKIEILSEHFMSNNLIEILKCLYDDDAIREAYNRRRECPKYFVDNVPYYIENIDRIGQKVSSKQGILGF